MVKGWSQPPWIRPWMSMPYCADLPSVRPVGWITLASSISESVLMDVGVADRIPAEDSIVGRGDVDDHDQDPRTSWRWWSSSSSAEESCGVKHSSPLSSVTVLLVGRWESCGPDMLLLALKHSYLFCETAYYSHCRVVVSVSTSQSRDGLETYQRLVSVSAIYVSCPRPMH